MVDKSAENAGIKINRRGFITLAAATALSSLPVVGLLTGKTPENEYTALKEFRKTNPDVFETASATYVPILETHNRKDITYKKIVESSPFIDLLFVEFYGQSSFFLDTKARELLFLGGQAVGTGQKLIDAGRFFSDNVLANLSLDKVEVSFEGLAIPPEFLKKGGIKLNSLGNIKKEVSGFVLNQMKEIVVEITDFSALRESLNSSGGEPADPILNTIYMIKHLNPADLVYLFRSLMMARKIINLTNSLASDHKNKNKPVVAYNVGYGHKSVKTIIELGKQEVFDVLSVYSDSTLRKIVDYNGGLEAFCSSVVVPVRESLRGNNDAKKVVLDSELKKYLGERFGVMVSRQNT